MSVAGDLSGLSSLAAPPSRPQKPTVLPTSKVQCGSPFTGGSYRVEFTPKWPSIGHLNQDPRQKRYHCFGIAGNKLSTETINKDAEGLLLNAIDMNFFDRLSLAWRILFPKTTVRRNTNANIAKQRLKMVLFSDRCAVSDEAKQKIVNSIVEVLSNFVDIDSQDKVELTVSTDPGLGTVYSVTIPVRRVKPEYQESGEDYTGITSNMYKDGRNIRKY